MGVPATEMSQHLEFGGLLMEKIRQKDVVSMSLALRRGLYCQTIGCANSASLPAKSCLPAVALLPIRIKRSIHQVAAEDNVQGVARAVVQHIVQNAMAAVEELAIVKHVVADAEIATTIAEEDAEASMDLLSFDGSPTAPDAPQHVDVDLHSFDPLHVATTVPAPPCQHASIPLSPKLAPTEEKLLDMATAALEHKEQLLAEEAEQPAMAAAEAQTRAEAERLAMEAAEAQTRTEAERLAMEAAATQAKAEEERLAVAAAEAQTRAEAERLAMEAAEAQAKAEEERLAVQAAEAQTKAKEERLAVEAAEAEAQARAEEERLTKMAAKGEAQADAELRYVTKAELAKKAFEEFEAQAKHQQMLAMSASPFQRALTMLSAFFRCARRAPPKQQVDDLV